MRLKVRRVCVCVSVCVRERERGQNKTSYTKFNIEKDFSDHYHYFFYVEYMFIVV